MLQRISTMQIITEEPLIGDMAGEGLIDDKPLTAPARVKRVTPPPNHSTHKCIQRT